MLEGVNGVMALTAYGLSFGQFTANNQYLSIFFTGENFTINFFYD